jgi:hypothetical protein
MKSISQDGNNVLVFSIGFTWCPRARPRLRFRGPGAVWPHEVLPGWKAIAVVEPLSTLSWLVLAFAVEHDFHLLLLRSLPS